MDLNNFTEVIIKGLQKKLGAGYLIYPKVIWGLNGTVKHSVEVSNAESGVFPCVNLDKYYMQYKSDEDIDTLLEKIVLDCKSEVSVKLTDISDFTYWENIKTRIFARLINTEKNVSLLSEIPNREYLDLSLVYYVRIETEQQGEYGMIQIRNWHMLQWEVDENILFQTARENLSGKEEALLESMAEILNSYLGTADNGIHMYVLGNTSRLNGAVQMCNRELLHKIAENFKDDVWILPSSIHEVVLLPAGCAENGAEGLADIVREVNDTQVEANEILSYHVYLYRRDTNEVVIAV